VEKFCPEVSDFIFSPGPGSYSRVPGRYPAGKGLGVAA
jgi:hypothetical protein